VIGSPPFSAASKNKTRTSGAASCNTEQAAVAEPFCGRRLDPLNAAQGGILGCATRVPETRSDHLVKFSVEGCDLLRTGVIVTKIGRS
jgi:hypothetical protein